MGFGARSDPVTSFAPLEAKMASERACMQAGQNLGKEGQCLLYWRQDKQKTQTTTTPLPSVLSVSVPISMISPQKQVRLHTKFKLHLLGAKVFVSFQDLPNAGSVQCMAELQNQIRTTTCGPFFPLSCTDASSEKRVNL